MEHNKTGFTLAEGCTLQPTKLRFGFTLAEVLITIGVIGVVAAMTIPNLIANYQKVQTANKLKKAYSMMAQAIRASQESEEENGNCLTMEPGETYSNTDFVEHTKKYVENCLAPYLKVSQICAPSSDKCWKNGGTTIDGVTKSIAQNGIDWGLYSVSFVLANGDAVYLWMGQPTQQWEGHIKFLYDIDGTNSGKSVLGKDIFAMDFRYGYNLTLIGYGRSRYDLLHNGASGDKSACSKEGATGSVSAGYYCGALIQRDGWTISKDYPW